MNESTTHKSRTEAWILLGLGCLALVISGISPKDYFTWFLEVAPVLLAIPLLLATFGRFRLTPLLYRLIFIHALILILGGHYTYAEVPLGFWVQDWLDLSRNHYDRLGHFAQGFVPAILARELLIRTSPLKPGKWLFFLVVCVALAFSAFYELIEWWTAAASGESADAFLGSQGDIWDAQWDMFLALIGSIVAQLSLSKIHDRQLMY
jgi:putative membrane protein